MGIASASPPGSDGKRVGETAFGGAAADIGKADPAPAMVNRRIAAVPAAATIARGNRGTSGPAARSRAEKSCPLRAGVVDG